MRPKLKDVHKVLDYNPDTGVFVWKVSYHRAVAGEKAGYLKNGYLLISIGGRAYPAHRLAWYMIHGQMPAGHLDHINTNKTDNRISNLRIASQAENCANTTMRRSNTSGWKGVSFNKKNNKWVAAISMGNKKHYLGSFVDVKEAAEAYIFAALEIHGEFARF